MSMKKRVLQIALFLAVMLLTFYALFSGRDLSEIGRAIMSMSFWYLIPSIALAVFFVCAEGFMIWYLLRSMKAQKEGYKASSLPRCIQYSFIGFFYSGITPSATGGQPVQLYYMNKDGNRGSDSTVVLMTVAVAYKFVLVVMGLGILLFWMHPLRQELGSYFPLYLLGLALNVILVILILGVMLFPKVILKLALLFEGLFIRLKIWKSSEKREEKINGFIDSYQQAVTWLKDHKGSLLVVIFVTFLQRCSVFVLTDLYGLSGIRSSGLRRNESDIASGSRIYCGGYAAPARCPGNYGAYVSGGVRSCVYRSIPDSVHACQQRYQFLFSADRKSGDRIGKSVCI